MIGEQNLTPAFFEFIQLVPADQGLQMTDVGVPGEHVVPLGTSPECIELTVIQKDIWDIGSVRTVNQIVESSIEEQGSPIRIKEHGRKPIVVVVDN